MKNKIIALLLISSMTQGAYSNPSIQSKPSKVQEFLYEHRTPLAYGVMLVVSPIVAVKAFNKSIQNALEASAIVVAEAQKLGIDVSAIPTQANTFEEKVKLVNKFYEFKVNVTKDQIHNLRKLLDKTEADAKATKGTLYMVTHILALGCSVFSTYKLLRYFISSKSKPALEPTHLTK